MKGMVIIMTKKISLFLMSLVLAVLSLTSCASKTAASKDDFTKAAEKHGFTVQDMSDDASASEYHESLTAAISKDGWAIGFHVLKEEANAKQYFTACKKEFNELKSGSSGTSSSSGTNYDTYSMTTGGMYMYAARVDNTVIYLSIPEDFKYEAKKVVEELDY